MGRVSDPVIRFGRREIVITLYFNDARCYFEQPVEWVLVRHCASGYMGKMRRLLPRAASNGLLFDGARTALIVDMRGSDCSLIGPRALPG